MASSWKHPLQTPQGAGAGREAQHWQRRWWGKSGQGGRPPSHADARGSGQNKAFKKCISVRTFFHFFTQKHVTHVYYWLSYIMLSWKVTVKVAQSCPSLCDPMDYRYRTFPGQNTGVSSCSLLQGIFPTQGSNPGFLHCRQILYYLSHQGSPWKVLQMHKITE